VIGNDKISRLQDPVAERWAVKLPGRCLDRHLIDDGQRLRLREASEHQLCVVIPRRAASSERADTVVIAEHALAKMSLKPRNLLCDDLALVRVLVILRKLSELRLPSLELHF